jgi:hypothetical protein
MREGYNDWMKWLENQLKIKSEDLAIEPQTMHEALQRRHILVHNGGRVSPQYLANINWLPDPPAVGVELKVDREYLDSAIDELTAVGASLSHLLMRKLCPQSRSEIVDNDALMLTYELLRQDRWKLVVKIADIVLPSITLEYPRTAVRVNRWIALKRSIGIDAITDDIKRWDISAAQQIFELARLILLDDPSAIPLAQDMIRRGDLSEEQIDLWPLFADIESELRKSENNDTSQDSPAPTETDGAVTPDDT